MTRRFRRAAAALIAGGLAATLAAPAHAGRTTNTMPVSLTVFKGCSLKTQAMTFILPAVVTNDTLDTTSTITIKCSPNTDYVIDLDDGLHFRGSSRRMFDPAVGYVVYEVYPDSPRSKVWRKGNFDGVSGNSGSGAAINFVLYGRVTNASKIKSGGYKDTLTVTLNC